ncbi:MAG TPA: MerR family transcriptional regulator [Bacteroidales bacterium]|jgi:Predicted transcriptional regulators
MAQYSIKDLEKLSGIQAHTIRIWEKRYHLVTPKRTTTNIRVYSDEDLKRLLNVAVLNHNGLKISKVAKLTDGEMKDRILQLSADTSNADSQIESLIVAMVELNELKFESILNAQFDQLGVEDVFIKIIHPFLVKIGVLWQTGNIHPAQEHFVSNIIRKKLFVAIDSLSLNTSGLKFIMFLPEGEYHEIGLLFYTYLVKKNGFQPIYLGQSVPYEDLISAQSAYNADYLFTSFVTTLQDFLFSEYVVRLSKTFRKQKVYIPGTIVQKLEVKRIPNIVKIKSPEHFKEILAKLK